MQAPRIGDDLVDWLRSTYPPRCIKCDEDAISAHRYSAKVELAQQLIQMAGRSSVRPGERTVEIE